MLLTRQILVAGLVLSALGGCKVRIDVPEGGRVETESGRYQCDEGTVCELDVRDTDFDERFLAVADGEHVFRGWRRGDGHFCGGSLDACALSTTGFPGNASLMEVLRSEQVFHLAPVFEPAEFYPVAGTVTVAAQSRADGDVNDAIASYTPNDLPSQAQPVSNPATIGGYANVIDVGEPGPSTEFGDPDDFYAVDLLAGQVIALNVADPEQGDLDLYLFDSNEQIVDFSLNTSYHESITVARSGRYSVNVYAYSGASNYTLSIGQPASEAAGGFTASADFDPETVVVQYRQANNQQARTASADEPQPRLENLTSLSAASAARAAGGPGKAGQFRGGELERKWRALSAIKALNTRADVAFAEPNYRYRASARPNDQYYPLQWHYRQINLAEAWDITRGSSDVVVAVIDTGVLGGHPDLGGKFVDGYDFISDPYHSGDGDGIDPDAGDPGDGGVAGQSSYHGSHVSGTVAAATNNGRGVAGVGWRTRVMPIRVLGEEGGTVYDIAQGIRYAAGLGNDSGTVPARRADVINLSLGGAGSSQALRNAIARARERGVIVVAAAGNENSSQPSYPAAYPGVISVGAVGPDGVRAPYSNFGATLDLVAPGGDMGVDLDGDGNTDGVISTVGSDTGSGVSYEIGLQQGTSMASPHVAGVIALMKAVRPSLTPAELDQWLLQGRLTMDLGEAGWDGQYGHGLLDAAKAVRTARTAGSGPDTSPPVLRVYPRDVALGVESQLITIGNGGGGALRIDGIASSVAWLEVLAEAVDDNGLGQYRLRLLPGDLSPGVYETTVRINSSAGSEVVRVIASVDESGASATSAGVLYVLLIDQAGETVDQRVLRPEDGGYGFRFDRVKEGRYRLTVGSDMDNDFYICDAGEACGAYRTLFNPDEIVLDRPRRGLSLNASFSPNINSAAAASGEGVQQAPLMIRRTGREGGVDDGGERLPTRRPWTGESRDAGP
ncbi:S8 family peptidase [Parahaliea mediterranea]|uniref:S8 family serine peptidase n=1 Tax=Parahaliea mediterranea TaxID=651086 RepID=A0A939ILB4_9GAMM|nr:S8 family peptidase [Parahaliea mediterranea]MBN7798211.1 S8 family serine peptidase [Parahaliea mediterranea]